MANVSLQPAPGRPVDRGDHRRRRARHLRRRRQELVDRHAALQLPVHRPAVLPDRGRPAGRPAARRRLPGDDDGLLGLDVGGRRPADLRARRRVQLRQGPARAGRAGEPRLPDGPVRERRTSSTPSRRPGDERAAPPRSSSSGRWPPRPPTARSPSSPSSSEANLRWAANSLTTNGAMRSRHVVVVSFVDGGAGMAAGTVARTGTPDVAALVAASEQAARDAGPAEDAVPLIGEAPPGAGDWDADPAETSIEVFARLRAGPGPGVRRGARPRRAAVRLRRALDGDDVPRHLDRAAAAARPADRPGRAQRQEPRLLPLGVGRRRAPATSATSRSPTSPPTSQRKMGWSQRRIELPAGPVRDAAAAVGGQRPDDLPLLDDGGPRRRRGPQRLRPARRRQPDRRAAGRAAADPAQRPRRARGWRPPRSRWSARRRARRRSSTTAWPRRR